MKSLAAGQRVVVVEDLNAFSARYGQGIIIAGQWQGQLSNRAEQLKLVADDQTIHDFAYDDRWYPTTDGDGLSLTIVDGTAELSKWGQAAGWQPSQREGGTPGRSSVHGDVDGNAKVDTKDIDLLYQQIRDQSNDPAFDLTGDGVADQADVDELVLNVIGTRYGDGNLDGKVDTLDFMELAANFGNNVSSWRAGDFNGDGRVTFSDFNWLSNNFGLGSAADLKT